ncbi:hypothetical protein RUM44_006090 [Polyplax serrata]|uniref:Uncharacterized protein n=1 Tax=Polyplax serrata TaxID=468196 RepID=A0ABR1B0J3_POLSC
MAQAGHSQGMGRRSSTLAGTISLKSMQRRSSLSALDSNTSVMSDLSFKRWHKRMQARHKSLGTEGFRLWTWCYRGCAPCRWFDSIDYEAKPCKYCIGFKRFKMIGTFCLMAIFIYTLLYVIWGDELLPGGTIFFMFLLFVVAYLTGYILLLVGLPPMIGHMLVGIVCGNMPPNWLPPHDKHYLERISFVVE